jgi:polysaccharide export outer membrane protein
VRRVSVAAYRLLTLACTAYGLVLIGATVGAASVRHAPGVSVTELASSVGPWATTGAACVAHGRSVLTGVEQSHAPAAQAPTQPAPQPPPVQQPPSPSPAPPQQPPAPQPTGTATTAPPKPAGTAAAAPTSITVPADYVIGPDDILSIDFWRDKDMSTDVVVRPDGQITLPLVSDVQAGGLTPEQLRDSIRQSALKFLEDPSVTVTVKQINSRKVFVMGQVGKPGAYPLSNPTTVLQLLSMAGGVAEFAEANKIMIMRTENGKQVALKFNYKDVAKGKNLQQNILLKPGDTVVVP